MESTPIAPPHSNARAIPPDETPTERITRLEAELAIARAELGPEVVAPRARPRGATSGTSTVSTSTDSTPLREGAPATSRWSRDELRARLDGAPAFREGRLDEEVLTRACEGYTRITGDPVHTPRKRNLVAADYRIHGDDFLPFVADLYSANGTATNLLGIMRSSPPRTLARGAPEDAPQIEEPLDGGTFLPENAPGRESSDAGRPWTPDEIDAALVPGRDWVLADETEPADEPADPDLGWRVEAMLPQVPEHGPIPELRARPDDLFHDQDDCVSCGEPLRNVRPRCGICNEAVSIVLGGLG